MTALTAGILRSADGTRCAATLLAGALLATSAMAADVTPEGLKSQQGSTWCWAAASQMVLKKVDSDGAAKGQYEQPAQAEGAILGCTAAPRDTCLDVNPVFAGCNRPGFPTFDLFGFTYNPDTKTPLTWDRLQEEATADHPVLFGWCIEGSCGDTTRTSMGHWMVAANTSLCNAPDSSKVQMVTVYNPAPCCIGQVLNISYSTYASGGAGLKFWRNYYDVERETARAATRVAARVARRVVEGTAEHRVETQRLAASATFPIVDAAEGEKKLAQDTINSCVPNDGVWKSSQLLRRSIEPPKDTATEVAPGDVISRRYLPVAALGALMTGEGYKKLAADPPPVETTIVPLTKTADGEDIASVILEKPTSGTLRVVGFEDSDAAHRLRILRAAAAKLGGTLLGEYVVVETGVHFLLVKKSTSSKTDVAAHGDDLHAIVILSDIDCRADPETVMWMSISELIERLTVSR